MKIFAFKVTLSSLNRHAVATLVDVGLPKVEVVKRALLKIIPWANIESFAEMFRLIC